MIEVGSRIREYEIVAPLKAGGMASLFLARRAGAAGFARTVAIKVIHAHLAADPDFVTMFVDEAKLSSRISHPNVVHWRNSANGRSFDANALDELEGSFAGMPAHSLDHQVGRQFQAEIMLSIGDVPGAIAAIEQGEHAGLWDLAWLDRCPLTARLREDAGFAPVRARIAERAMAVAAGWS